jgi:hypothetical protein
VRSLGRVLCSLSENPNIIFIHDLKKKVGPIKYKNTSRNRAPVGKRSKKNEKNKISEIKNIDPGNPRKIKILSNVTRKSLGHKKLSPLISVINLVLKRRAMASTRRNELVDINAWLMSIAKLASRRFDCPLIIHIVSQCISTTVEYATSFLRSI